MGDEQNERRVYVLSKEHEYEWADLEDLVPKEPKVPDALQPFFPTGEAVDEVDDLFIYDHDNTPPHFAQGQEAVEATPEELADWRSLWASAEEAQQAFRHRVKEAQEAYEETARQALADLATAMEPWAAVEATLKERSLELAVKLQAHRTAAEQWRAEQEAKKQEHLDALHGPRAIVLYKPQSLSSRNKADHIARVHLVTCKRRPKGSQGYDARLRADNAWYRLTHPTEWIADSWGDLAKAMRVKFCSSCKPWTVFEERIKDFPRPRYDGLENPVLGDVRLTDLPEAWTR